MYKFKSVLALVAVASLTACSGGGGGDDSVALAQPTDNTAPAVEKVSFSALARDMIDVAESEEAWDISQFDIDMDIDENAEPTAFDDLFVKQP